MRGLRLEYLRAGAGTSDDQWQAAKQKWIAEVAPLCGGEQVLAAAKFRSGGATAAIAANRVGFGLGGLGGQMLASSATRLARKKRAGGLPERVVLAVTPTKVYAFDDSFEVSRKRRERETGGLRRRRSGIEARSGAQRSGPAR